MIMVHRVVDYHCRHPLIGRQRVRPRTDIYCDAEKKCVPIDMAAPHEAVHSVTGFLDYGFLTADGVPVHA